MHPSTQSILEHFSYQHLPDHLREVSEPISQLAHAFARHPHLEGPELTTGLRKLLEAKDCLVRAAIPRTADERQARGIDPRRTDDVGVRENPDPESPTPGNPRIPGDVR